MSIKPGTKAKVSVPKAQISYMAKNSKYSYQQIIKLIQNILEDVLKDTKVALKEWIDNKVPKRTGQLRFMLKTWLDGSNVGEGLLQLVIGTNLDYAEDVDAMTTSQVRHNKEWGYVYYPNIFGISSKTRPRGSKKILLDDPRAIGGFWDKMIEFAKEELDKNLIRAKNKHLGQAVKRAKAGAMAVS